MNSALKKKEPSKVIKLGKGKSTKEKVENTLTEELFFAVCSPIGSLKERAILELKQILQKQYGYVVKTIKLSKFIVENKLESYKTIENKTEIFSQYKFKIDQGNKLRKNYTSQILAELSIADIHLDRVKELEKENHLKDTSFKSRRVCYIFDSLKNKEELKLIRSVYTDNFYQISIFSPKDERVENLIDKGFSKNEANEIIEIDEYQNNIEGQNVRGTFVEGDFFLRSSFSNQNQIKAKVERYLLLVFEAQIVTPTIEETAMFYAKSAANNSSCLSRQVGASIVDYNGNLISTGWNDVPKYGGNLYNNGSVSDDRCFNNGFCTNDREKDNLTNNIVDVLFEDEELEKVYGGKKADLKKRIRASKIKDLIEFSRSVHAEMHAIVLGSQLTGKQMVNGKLFCTTYPCHNCARHIILSGIKEVHYIEPYVKSLCLTLHEDSITEDEKENNKVKILIFDGVSPRKYQTFFTNFADRKENGKLISRIKTKLKPKSMKSLQALPELERQAIHSITENGLFQPEQNEK